MMPAMNQRLFSDCRSHLAAFSKEALTQLYQVGKSVVGGNDRRTALFQKAFDAYQKGKVQYQALKGEVETLRNELEKAKAAAANLAEIQHLREQLVKAQETTAEVPALRESLKNVVPVA
ncbi:hypothetical protein ACQ4PT_027068 [Festuca glaucescens]